MQSYTNVLFVYNKAHNFVLLRMPYEIFVWYIILYKVDGRRNFTLSVVIRQSNNWYWSVSVQLQIKYFLLWG